jgi:hypothetical protein
VAVSVVDRNNDYRSVIVQRTVEERRHEGADEHIDRLAQKYLGKERYPWHRPNQQRVILGIKPDHVMEQGTQEA